MKACMKRSMTPRSSTFESSIEWCRGAPAGERCRSPAGCGRARPGAEVAALGLGAARRCGRLGAILRGHQVLDLELLLGGQREQLVGGLSHLQRAFGALA